MALNNLYFSFKLWNIGSCQASHRASPWYSGSLVACTYEAHNTLLCVSSRLLYAFRSSPASELPVADDGSTEEKEPLRGVTRTYCGRSIRILSRTNHKSFDIHKSSAFQSSQHDAHCISPIFARIACVSGLLGVQVIFMSTGRTPAHPRDQQLN